MAASASSAASPLSALSPAALLDQLTAACDVFDATGAKEAEAFLLAFRSMQQPFDFTRYAVQHATSARLLHLVVSTHLTALMRQWRQLSVSDRQRESEALLWFVSERASQQPAFVSSQSAHAAGLLLSRYWSEGQDSAEWADKRLQQLVARLTALPAATALSSVRLSIDIAQCLVSELSLSSPTLLSFGVSAASLVSAHTAFERLTLLPQLTRILTLIRSLSSAVHLPDTADVLLHSARAVECCLSWRFDVDRDTALRYLSSVATERDATVRLSHKMQPPVAWRSLLLETDVLSLLAQCGRQVSLSTGRCLDVLLCLQPLASLSGAIFHQASEQSQFMDLLIRHTCTLLDAQQQQQKHVGQPLDGALLSVVHSILSAAMTTVSLPCLFTQASFQLWLACLSHMTHCVLHDESFTRSSFTSGTDTTLAESLHAMLATWAELAMASHEERVRRSEQKNSRADNSETSDSISVAVLDVIEQQCSQVFSLYITRRLKREVVDTGECEDSDRQDQAEEQFAGADNEQEHLVSLAFLARLQPVLTLTHYQQLLHQVVHSYSALLSSTTSSASSVSSVDLLSCSDRLLLLIDLLSCILTDSAEGESSVIPSMFLSSPLDSAVLESVVHCVLSLLSLMRDAVRAGDSGRVSPLLAVSVMSLLSRISMVYVDVDTVHARYSALSSVRGLLLSSVCLSRLVSVQFDAAYSFLSLWYGESDVHLSALHCLSPLISQRRSRSIATSATGYSELRQLLHSAASSLPSASSAVTLDVVDRWSSATQSLLVCVLSQSCDDDRALQLLWSPIQARVSCVVQCIEQSTSKWLSDPCAAVYCASSVSLLCGVSESTSAASFDAGYAALSARWADLNRLLRAAITVPSATSVVSAVLSLLVSTAEHQIAYMDSSQSSRFMVQCVDSVSHFLQAMQQRVAALQSSVVQSEVDLLADSYEEDVTLLLRLLSELVRDDSWAAGLDSVERSGELCVLAVTTLASDALFMQLLASSASSSSSSPSTVLSLFFSLLHDAFTTHTERVAALPSAVRARLISLLLQAPSAVTRQCVQCMASLASYCAKHPSTVEDDVARTLHWLLSTLLRQSVSSALVEPISDALLACCVAIPQRIDDMATAAITHWQQQQQQGTASAAHSVSEFASLHCRLVGLVSTNGVRAELSMDNKRKVRANVRRFVNEVNTNIVG